MLCPAAPLDGLSDAMVGGPPGETAAVVEVDVDVDVEEEVEVEGAALVDGVREAGVLVCVERAAVVDGGAEPLFNVTINAMAAATTSAAATATDPMSQPLGRAGPEPVSGRIASRAGKPPRGRAPSRRWTSPTGRTSSVRSD